MNFLAAQSKWTFKISENLTSARKEGLQVVLKRVIFHHMNFSQYNFEKLIRILSG